MIQTIKGQDVQPGMIVKTKFSEDNFAVEKVGIKWGSVQVRNHYEWIGLEVDENVELLGHFNTED